MHKPSPKSDLSSPLLQVRDLRTSFFTPDGEVKAVDGVSFSVSAGKTLGIVGESGCGKSVTSLSLLRLITGPVGRIVGGEILFEGVDLLQTPEAQMRRIRGNRISMIFQEPMTSLNPVFSVGNQVAEVLILHAGLNKRDARSRTIELLKLVGIPAPDKRVDDYPHQLSGGMRQRVMIAMALACDPRLLVADEPTTALDVTIQAQILDLLRDLQQRLGMALILITHDLGVVAEMADEVVVMYAGKVAEYASTAEIFRHARHPYTQGLLNSVPRLRAPGSVRPALQTIPGMVPNLLQLPQGCRFQERCAFVEDRCRGSEPPLIPVPTEDHTVHTAACLRSI